MILYFYLHLFYSRKRTIFILGFIIWIGLMTLMIYHNEPVFEQRLYRAQNQIYYEQIMRSLLMLLCPFFVVLITMDHDQQHLKPMISYFGRKKIACNKLFFYFLVLTWLYAMFFMIYHILPFYLTSYYTYDTSSYMLFLNLYTDGLMTTLLVFIFIKDKHKAFSILIALFYVFYSFLLEDHPNIIFFYLFPQFSAFFSTLTLAYYYKLCYICLGLTIYFFQINFETL
ncbi:MAG: hypothetical protein K9L02_05050 [Acholeplasmataceae bacterium]|nr:hypothetical protein [Acholeplasmataceae bacterium]